MAQGENLTGIAQKYGTSVDGLLKANSSITDPNKIQIGQVLNIPVASSVNASVPSAQDKPAPKTPYKAGNTSTDHNNGGKSLTANQIKAIMPHCSHPEYLDNINAALKEGQINTSARQAAFLAQLAHESGELVYMEEIASGEAYEGRKDLGNTQPGDGKRFKGRGPIQLTGRSNYRMAGKALGLDLESHPESVATPEIGFRVSVWFWTSHELNTLADKNTLESFDKISKTINGGITGQAERRAYWNKAKSVLDSK